MAQFKIITPNKTAFVVTSETAQIALVDLKSYLRSLDPPGPMEGEFTVTIIEYAPFVAPMTGVFAGLTEKILAQGAVLMAERNALPPSQIN